MEQKFEGEPKAELRLEGHRVTRGEITNDWASQVRFEVRRDGQVIATPPARVTPAYEHADKTPGKYEVVLQMWKYENYAKDKDGNFTKSKFIGISNKVEYTIA